MEHMRKISFIGMGYVGLCTAVCLANEGFKIIISTNDPEKVEMVKKGTSPFYEPQLEALLKKVIKNENLKAVVGRKEAILETDISFITVGTPTNPDGSVNLKFVEETSKEIGEALKKKENGHLIVVKSTVPPGTTEKLIKTKIEKQSGKTCGEGFLLCFNPEFLREGNAMYDTLNPDYIVIGGYNKKSAEALENLYEEFHKESPPPIIRTNIPTAELIKYANNAFLATKISFINTIANVCEKIPGADITKVAEAIGKDHRINPYFLNAGLGWGGSCFPKDVKALIAYSRKIGYNPTLIRATDEANQDQIKFTIQKVKKELGTLKGKKIAILGLAFKPDTDDMREARSIKIINELLKQGAKIVAYDPMAISNANKILKEKINYASSVIECLKEADCAILVTEWEEFKKLKPEDFIQNMRKPILIDGRRLYNPEEFKKLRYVAIGLGEPLRRNFKFAS
jgi:UDPglucose 6-dehydrogenase